MEKAGGQCISKIWLELVIGNISAAENATSFKVNQSKIGIVKINPSKVSLRCLSQVMVIVDTIQRQ